MAEGNAAKACPKFADSHRLDPAAGTLLNLAACYEKVGQRATAWLTYKEAAELADRTKRTEWATKAKEKANALAPTLSTLEIRAPSAIDSLRITSNDVDVESVTWGAPVPVDGGTYVIEAKAPGYQSWSTRVAIAESSEHRTVAIPALTRLKPAAEAPAPLPPTKNTQKVVALVTGGIGIVGIGVGTYFGLRAGAKKSEAEGECTSDFRSCTATGIDLYDSAKSSATVSTIGFVAGTTLLATGIVLYLTAPTATAVRVHASINGASIRGEF